MVRLKIGPFVHHAAASADDWVSLFCSVLCHDTVSVGIGSESSHIGSAVGLTMIYCNAQLLGADGAGESCLSVAPKIPFSCKCH